MKASQVGNRFIHLLYWDLEASLFLSKLTKNMLSDEYIINYKKLLTSCRFWSFIFLYLPFPKLSTPPQIPHLHNMKGLEINLQHLRANLSSNKQTYNETRMTLSRKPPNAVCEWNIFHKIWSKFCRERHQTA